MLMKQCAHWSSIVQYNIISFVRYLVRYLAFDIWRSISGFYCRHDSTNYNLKTSVLLLIAFKNKVMDKDMDSSMDSSRDRDKNNINTCRVDEQDKFRQRFWNKIQAELGACVPEYLKNILKYNNFDNPLSFRDITEEIIDDLENFAKTLLIELIEDDVNVDMKSYFGIFHKKPNNFRFVIGDKMLIRRMVDFIKSTSLSYWNTKSHEEVNSLVNSNSQSSHSISE
ncbi:uncharacterized protein LOC122507622 [Leptopilina heterotoma]|uniref:uncharacterized protein LOC122507622 n=1 Tax=Leptopilina heterotoma TaxID=63436 RepID=UPI001CA909C6|nr:uncharacterized protein LOC122507622 [Leptopilina heterotoma]